MRILYSLAGILFLAACAAPLPPHASIQFPARSSSSLALAPNGSLLAAVNPDSGTTTLVDARSLTVLTEIGVAGNNPQTAAFDAQGKLLVVANRGADTVSFVGTDNPAAPGEIYVGPQPYGVVADERRAYVSLFAAGQVAVVDFASQTLRGTIDVEPFPAGLALSGGTLYVTHLYTGRLSVIDTAALIVKTVIPADAESNLSQFILLSPDGARAYLPLTLAHAAVNPIRYNEAVTPAVRVLDLAQPEELTRLDLAALDRPVNLPSAAALSPDGRMLYVANAGSDDVSVIDLVTGRAAAHFAVGRNPRGLALSLDGAQLFVNNTLDGTLDVFDTRTGARTDRLRLTTIPLPANILAGQRLFNSALAPMSRDHWLSCATCHFDGGMDGRTWLGFADGPRNTPALFGAAHTLPLHWSGDLDELQDVEATVRNVQGGAGLVPGAVYGSLSESNASRSAELDALAAYVATLDFPASPGGTSAGPEAEAIQRGEYAFRRWGCAGCHGPPLYTDLKSHIVEIGDPVLEHNQHGLAMDTPSLVGVWGTAPYFHDGSAAALRDTFFSTGFHSMGFAMDAGEAQDLVAFLRSLSYRP